MTGRRDGLPRPSPFLVAWFQRYGSRYLARYFHAVRLARAGRPDPAALRGRPVVVCLNHPAWWDPMVCAELARRLFPDRRHFAVIEEAALGRYRFFAKLGFFGVEPGTTRGARRFLSLGERILELPDAVLWITAGGRFADPRERPVRLRPGLGHLLRRSGPVTVLPLALEYPFWEERFPEALARFGEPVRTGEAGLTPEEWTAFLEEQLEAAQDELAAAALTRDPERFDILATGRAGVGGVYDLWRRLRARLHGEAFQASHGREANP